VAEILAYLGLIIARVLVFYVEVVLFIKKILKILKFEGG